MASRKRNIREMMSSPSSSEGSGDDQEVVEANKAEVDVESCNADANHPSKKQQTGLRRAASASPETVQRTGLKVLLEAERTMNPHSYIGVHMMAADVSNNNNNITGDHDDDQHSKNSLPILVPTQFSPHQAWSEQTAKWCYDVLDHLQLPREIVYLAMNILEKALLGPDREQGITNNNDNNDCSVPPITNKHDYEKMAIASLFLAVRLVSTRKSSSTSSSNNTNKSTTSSAPSPRRNKLQISELLIISGSSWTVPDIQQCSSTILKGLGLYTNDAGAHLPATTGASSSSYSPSSWNFALHQALVQATPHSFCKLLFFGFHKKDDPSSAEPAVIPRQTRLEWLELALYLIELSVCDGGFHRLLPSVIALASLQTAAKILQSQQQQQQQQESTDYGNNNNNNAFQTCQRVMEETLCEAYGVSQLPNTAFVGNRLEFIYQQSQDNRTCANQRRNNNNKARRTNNSTSPSARGAFTCPTLIIDDEEYETALQQSVFSSSSMRARRLGCNQETTPKQAPVAAAAAQAKKKNHQQQQGFSNHHHPIRHIQSDLNLEALGRQHAAATRMHRPISPCPTTIHHFEHQLSSRDNKK